jgi:hypothetical protein
MSPPRRMATSDGRSKPPGVVEAMAIALDGVAKESNLPSVGLPRLTGFEDRLGHRPRPLPAGSAYEPACRDRAACSQGAAAVRCIRMHVIPLPMPLAEEAPGVHVTADAPNAYPCRRCLRDAEPGEALLLTGYDPFTGASPYSGRGPIYVHESSCAPFAGDAIPEQLTRRLLSVRAYDERHMLVDSDVTDGARLEAVAERLLGTTGAAYLHVHNARPGCFAARIDP